MLKSILKQKSKIIFAILIYSTSVFATAPSCTDEDDVEAGVSKLLVNLYCGSSVGTEVAAICRDFRSEMSGNGGALTENSLKGLKIFFLGEFLRAAAQRGRTEFERTAREFSTEVAEYGISTVIENYRDAAVASALEAALRRLPGISARLARQAARESVERFSFAGTVIDFMLNFGNAENNMCVVTNIISDIKPGFCSMERSYNSRFVKFLIMPLDEQMDLLAYNRIQDGNNCQLFQEVVQNPPRASEEYLED